MIEQPDIFGGTTILGLTRRQQAVYEHAVEHPDGVTADEAGAVAHALRAGRPHPADERCEWCQQDGRSVLEALVAHGLLRRRRAPAGGYRYVPANGVRPRPAGMLADDEEIPF